MPRIRKEEKKAQVVSEYRKRVVMGLPQSAKKLRDQHPEYLMDQNDAAILAEHERQIKESKKEKEKRKKETPIPVNSKRRKVML